MKLRRYRLTNRRSHRRYFSENHEPGKILALRRRDGNQLFDDHSLNQADMNFDVLAVQNKSNVRLSISHIKAAQEEEFSSEPESKTEAKHIAPQHRRYLTHSPKIGAGTPQERTKAAMRLQLNRAAAIAHQYQLEKLGFVDEGVNENSLTQYKGINAIVEDKIQLSILKGDFDNLPGAGKPLETFQNPLVDRTTELAYGMLRKNGIAPDWVESQKKMTALKDDIRVQIRHSWAEYCITYHSTKVNADSSGSYKVKGAFVMPSIHFINSFSQELTAKLHQDETICNSFVDLYNLQVPSHMLTMGRISVVDEIHRHIQNTFTSLEEVEAVIRECVDLREKNHHLKYVALREYLKRNGGNSLRRDDTRPDYSRLSRKSNRYSESIYGGNLQVNHASRYPRERGPFDRVVDEILNKMANFADNLAKYLIKWLV